MTQFCTAYENGLLEQNDQNNAMYKNYKTLITTLTKEEIIESISIRNRRCCLSVN